MKITKTEKMVLIFTVLVLLALIASIYFLTEHITEVGLKNILMEIWEGE